MRNMIIITFIVNVVYFTIWFLVNKVRNAKSKVREYDNGYEFYASLNSIEKEKYWKEDTKNVNIFFIIFLVFLEISMYLLFKENNLWIASFIVGLILSSIIVIVLSIKLQKKYQ
ncbi:MAG: hypothetical protein EOM50_01950 [Erysipelotrichia bacterium]|nr:hypothetical protein [Erysipelotrichia bacterium]NCC54695.1 hypothetical protein [Erysipelotrichia bacterium]